MVQPPARERLDKWLWAARFMKTRALAVEQIDKGRVLVNGQAAKPARELQVGDLVELRHGEVPRTLRVLGLSLLRGPAPQAQALYAETPESLQAQAEARERRRQGVEPGLTLAQGRPTKRDRRSLAQWQRWSVSLDQDDSGA